MSLEEVIYCIFDIIETTFTSIIFLVMKNVNVYRWSFVLFRG